MKNKKRRSAQDRPLDLTETVLFLTAIFMSGPGRVQPMNDHHQRHLQVLWPGPKTAPANSMIDTGWLLPPPPSRTPVLFFPSYTLSDMT